MKIKYWKKIGQHVSLCNGSKALIKKVELQFSYLITKVISQNIFSI